MRATAYAQTFLTSPRSKDSRVYALGKLRVEESSTVEQTSEKIMQRNPRALNAKD